jgi:hypothetical protein
VTRLGEYSPTEWLLTLESFLKIKEVANIFLTSFLTAKLMY